MIVMFVDSADGFVRETNRIGNTVSARNISGPRSVAMMNHLVRTRSRYSRRMIALSLSMTAHPRFDTGGPDFLEEDGMQGRLHTLESLQ